MISTTKNLSRETHRVFKVVEQKHNSTIVEDEISKETYVSKKLYVPENSEVILFVKKIVLDYYNLPKLND